MVITGTRPLEENLVLDLKLNEGAGTIAHDYSGYRNHGTFKGAGEPAWISGGGADWDGADDVITVIDHASLDIVTAITVMMWFERASPLFVGRNTLLSKSSSAYEVGGNQASDELLIYITIGGNLRYLATTTANILQNTLYHVAYVFPTADSKIGIYINGVLEKESAVYTGNIGVNATNVTIGRRGAVTFEGKIYEPRIYDVALSPEDIALIYAQRRRT